jgi:hypothetical protein
MIGTSKHKIILLCGRICSGKGSYLPDASRIIVSNIVRAIVNSSSRDALQNSLHLDEQIAKKILEGPKLMEHAEEIIIDGIRQVSIVNKILDVYPDAEMIWLEVPTEERKRRYESRKDIKDVEPFEVADNKPIELECQNIFSTFKDKLTIINNYGIN